MFNCTAGASPCEAAVSPHPSSHRLRLVRYVVIPGLQSVLRLESKVTCWYLCFLTFYLTFEIDFPNLPEDSAHTTPTMATAGAAVYPSLENRPLKDTVVLFDVDETLSPARQVCTS